MVGCRRARDHAGGTGPLSTFWAEATCLAPATQDESDLPGATAGDLTRLFEQAGLRDVEETALTVRLEFATFEGWWQPFTLGVGPAGAHVAALSSTDRTALAGTLRAEYGAGPFTVEASAWTATGLVTGLASRPA